MAKIRVNEIPPVYPGYDTQGKKIMIHDLDAPLTSSTNLIDAEEILSDLQTTTDRGNITTNPIIIGDGDGAGESSLSQGQQTFADADFSSVGGVGSKSFTKSEWVRGSGFFVAPGDCQTSIIQLMASGVYLPDDTTGVELTVGDDETTILSGIDNGYTFTMQYSYVGKFSDNSAVFFEGAIGGTVENDVLNYSGLISTAFHSFLTGSNISIIGIGIELNYDYPNREISVRSKLVSSFEEAMLSKELMNLQISSVRFTYDAPCIPPAILTQPANQDLSSGMELILFVLANGTGPLSYQWIKNGVNINGATESVLTIASTHAIDSANYVVRITNACGAITSGPAEVNISECENMSDIQIDITYNYTIYYNVSDTTDILEADILTSPSAVFNNTEFPEANFISNVVPKYLWCAIPGGMPFATEWFCNDDNKGVIGEDDGLFANPVLIGELAVYITNYKTQNNQDTFKLRH